MKNSDYSNKNILVVSNNPFSETNNNGKTLASLVRDHPKDNVFQLYFSEECPSFEVCNNFFKISDLDILKRKNGNQVLVGEEIHTEKKINGKNNKISILTTIKNNQFSRSVRESIWSLASFDKSSMFDWIKETNIDMIIFCAGDSIFAYDIVMSIVERYDTKLAVYITDDYVLPRMNMSVFWWLRRQIIMKKMTTMIGRADLFLTISNKMREKYETIFKKDSLIYYNNPENIFLEGIHKDNERIELIYAGGFHYNRWKVLHKIAKSIEKYNNTATKKAFLSIYSNSIPNKKILDKLNVNTASQYLGQLNSEELKIKLNEADVLVHAEAFDNRSKASTMLSFSTKISEYISLNKAILAVGPCEVASIEYLSKIKSTLLVNNIKELDKKLTNFFMKNNISKTHINDTNYLAPVNITTILSNIFDYE